MDDEEPDDQDEQATSSAAGSVLAMLDNGDHLAPLVPAGWVPPGLMVSMAGDRGVRAGIQYRLALENPEAPSLDEVKARVHRELDPIGMAVAIAQGLPIPVYGVKDGQVVVKYVAVAMRERLSMAKKLMDIVVTQDKKPDPQASAKTSSDPHAFLAMVKRAGEAADEALSGLKIIDQQAAMAQADLTDEDKSFLDGA